MLGSSRRERGRRFPHPWTVEKIPGGFKIVDALNKLAVEDPATFVRVAAGVVPKQLDTELAKRLQQLTDAAS